MSALLCVPLSALADDRGAEYTMRVKDMTVSQNPGDRGISVNEADLAANPVIPGESPVTGLPVEGELAYMPMLATIDNADFTITYQGKKTTGGGLGKRAPWGLQWADIIYESLIYRTGYTRMTGLFSDSLSQGQPVSVGPVRSARLGTTLLAAQWQGGVVYAGGPSNQEYEIGQMLEAQGETMKGVFFNLWKNSGYRAHANRVRSVKAPGNLNVNLAALRQMVDTPKAEPHPFLFADVSPYGEGYQRAISVHLDWGQKTNLSHFFYGEDSGLYRRFSGNAPYRSFASEVDADSRDESAMTDMSFRNVIIQRVYYEYPGDNKINPVMQGVGRGNADIFIGGRYIPGYWVRETAGSPTVFFDDQGNELRLLRGKTFIAHFPPEALLAFGAE